MKKDVILWIVYAAVIFGAVYAPQVPVPFVEGLMFLCILILVHVAYQSHSDSIIAKKLSKHNEDILNDIFKYFPDIIFYKDKNFKYFNCNKTFADWHGGAKKFIIGKTDYEVMPNDFEVIRQYDEIVMKTKECISYEQSLQHKPGDVKYFHTIKAPVFNSKNEFVGILGISRDITELKEVEQQKDNFVETLTHDLKAPTNAQIKALELILNGGFGELNPEQKEILTCTLNSCRYMMSMISNILSTYKYDKGIKALKIVNFNFKQLLDESLNEMKYLCEDKHLNLAVEVKDSVNSISGDLIEIKRVVINLISNAMYYAVNESSIQIVADVVDDKFVFKIYTKSNPLTQEEINNLFEKFFTGVAKYRPVGSGLGLYLSKHIVELHNGKMLFSADENGNMFGFELPLNMATN